MGKFFVNYAVHSFSQEKEDLETVKQNILKFLPKDTEFVEAHEQVEPEYSDFRIVRFYFTSSEVEEGASVILHFKRIKSSEDKSVIVKVEYISKEEQIKAIENFEKSIKKDIE
jgi:hypothetical protein